MDCPSPHLQTKCRLQNPLPSQICLIWVCVGFVLGCFLAAPGFPTPWRAVPESWEALLRKGRSFRSLCTCYYVLPASEEHSAGLHNFLLVPARTCAVSLPHCHLASKFICPDRPGQGTTFTLETPPICNPAEILPSTVLGLVQTQTKITSL